MLQRPRFLLRDAADINRLINYLMRHWKPPGVEVRIERLPLLDSLRVQERFFRLAQDCNCVVGEMLGIATLLLGCWVSWISLRGHINVGQILFAALVAAVIGKLAELAWTRTRLWLLLRDLRHRLEDTLAGRVARTTVKVPDAIALGEQAAGRHFSQALNRGDGEALRGEYSEAIALADESDRARLPLRNASDIRSAALHLLVYWRLPLMNIELDVLPRPIVERAQDRLVRLAAGYNYLLPAGVMVVSFLAASAWLLWPSENVLIWKMETDWPGVLIVLAVTASTGLIAIACEVLWVRARLLWILARLWTRLREFRLDPG